VPGGPSALLRCESCSQQIKLLLSSDGPEEQNQAEQNKEPKKEGALSELGRSSACRPKVMPKFVSLNSLWMKSLTIILSASKKKGAMQTQKPRAQR
jgi:hypothetical protein